MMKLEKAIDLYNSVGIRDGNFLFNWLKSIYDFFYFPSIDKKYAESLSEIKTKLTIYDVLLDDLADNKSLRDKKKLERACNIPWDGSEFKDEYLEAMRKIWVDCQNSIKKYPRFSEFEELFYYDLEQIISSMKYSYFVNTHNITSYRELKEYVHHGVMVIVHGDLDLMCSPKFETEELSSVRTILHAAQNICHIGNMLATYEKEVKEHDFSSPIITYAIEEGIISNKMIEKNPGKAVSEIKKVKDHFEERVKNNFEIIEQKKKKAKTVSAKKFKVKVRKVYDNFMERKKYW